MLDQRFIFNDGYNQEDTLDACIIDLVRATLGTNIAKSLLMPQENMIVSLEEDDFKNISRILETEQLYKHCLISNLRLDATFSLNYVDDFIATYFTKYNESWVNSTFQIDSLVMFYLKFPTSAIVNEVILLFQFSSI